MRLIFKRTAKNCGFVLASLSNPRTNSTEKAETPMLKQVNGSPDPAGSRYLAASHFLWPGPPAAARVRVRQARNPGPSFELGDDLTKREPTTWNLGRGRGGYFKSKKMEHARKRIKCAVAWSLMPCANGHGASEEGNKNKGALFSMSIRGLGGSGLDVASIVPLRLTHGPMSLQRVLPASVGVFLLPVFLAARRLFEGPTIFTKALCLLSRLEGGDFVALDWWYPYAHGWALFFMSLEAHRQ